MAIEAAAEGRDVILARPFTEADDVAGFHAAVGILTSEGGKASHAALVARGMGVPAVTGAASLEIDPEAGEIRLAGEVVLRAGDRVAIDGSAGAITGDDVPLVEPEMSEAFETVLGWADELRALGVRTNADTPEDAAKAREFGAEGIGLCRTEHMFFGAERNEAIVAVILADTDEERQAGLRKLLPLQQGDFEEIFAAMAGLPVTVRLLDPPLHEFLPSLPDVEERLREAEEAGSADVETLEHDLARVRVLQEVNPMLGTRGVRLGILFPAIYEMQVEAIFARARRDPRQRPRGERRDHGAAGRLPPRARDPARADRRDRRAGRGRARPRLHDRDDDRAAPRLPARRRDRRGGRLLLLRHQRPDPDRARLQPRRHRGPHPRPLHRREGLRPLARSRPSTRPASASWSGWAPGSGRKTKADLKLGVCGEHGGDPDSIDFFHNSGIDYVSCSPYRVPVARVAAAQAAIRAGA